MTKIKLELITDPDSLKRVQKEGFHIFVTDTVKPITTISNL